MGDWPSFLDEAGPMPGLSGAADEARDRLVETFVKYIQIQKLLGQLLSPLVHKSVQSEFGRSVERFSY